MSKNENGRRVRINEDAKDFAKLKYKRFKKKNGDMYDSKKEIKEAFMAYLMDLLPDTIDFCVKYGYIQDEDVQETKNKIYKKISDPDFIKVLKKELKNGNKIENIKLLPIIIKEILLEAKRVNAEAVAANPNADVIDVSDMVELSKKILKKKMKKMEKEGISQGLAFDVLSIIPSEDALKSSQFYRIHSFYNCLYENAKGTAVPFDKIMEIIIDKEYWMAFITFALLERKEKFSKLTDAQKTLYLDITTWCFSIMEKKLSKEELESVIKTFINNRKRDEAQGKDGNRRYALSSLSADDYPRINKLITKMIANDDTIKKYL